MQKNATLWAIKFLDLGLTRGSNQVLRSYRPHSIRFAKRIRRMRQGRALMKDHIKRSGVLLLLNKRFHKETRLVENIAYDGACPVALNTSNLLLERVATVTE